MASNNYIRLVGYGLFERLQIIATDSELVALIDHSNATIKGYAFKALIGRKNVDVFTRLMKHISGLLAAYFYPHSAFYSNVKHVFGRRWSLLNSDSRIFLDDIIWKLICEFLAQYPSKETYKLFKKIAKLNDDDESQSIKRNLLHAV